MFSQRCGSEKFRAKFTPIRFRAPGKPRERYDTVPHPRLGELSRCHPRQSIERTTFSAESKKSATFAARHVPNDSKLRSMVIMQGQSGEVSAIDGSPKAQPAYTPGLGIA